MLHARNSRGSNTAELVITQILQGAGGGIAAVASQTAAQGSVPHQGVHRFICGLGEFSNATLVRRCCPYHSRRPPCCRIRECVRIVVALTAGSRLSEFIKHTFLMCFGLVMIVWGLRALGQSTGIGCQLRLRNDSLSSIGA